MRSKKGFLKILEAFIAILLIAGVLVFLYTTQIQRPNQEEYIGQIQKIILDEIADDDSLRIFVLRGNKEALTSYIAAKGLVPDEFQFEILICEINLACQNTPSQNIGDKEVFVDEVSISSTLEEFNPKILRIFFWEK